jgi:hypothetical protein
MTVQTFRAMFIGVILCTDMSRHGEYLTKMEEFALRRDALMQPENVQVSPTGGVVDAGSSRWRC